MYLEFANVHVVLHECVCGREGEREDGSGGREGERKREREREREMCVSIICVLPDHCRALASSKSVPLDPAPPKEVGRKKKRYPMTPQEGVYSN